MDEFDGELEARKKRVMEKEWVRMIDLPGFDEWSAHYRGLETILPAERCNHRVLVHPDELNQPLDWIFEREYQSHLDDYADHGGPRRRLDEFKKA